MEKINVKKDCFGYHCAAKKCTVLTETICAKRKCSFYKTQKQYDEDKQKYERLWVM